MRLLEQRPALCRISRPFFGIPPQPFCCATAVSVSIMHERVLLTTNQSSVARIRVRARLQSCRKLLYVRYPEPTLVREGPALLSAFAARTFGRSPQLQRDEKQSSLGTIQSRWPVTAISVLLLALTVLVLPAAAQESSPPSRTDSAEPASETQPDSNLQDSIAHDVLEPLQTGIQTQNLKQVLAVFDADSAPQVRDQLRALFENYSVLQFRYKLTQVSSEGGRVSAICEVDLDATPLDQTSAPLRHSNLLHLQLKQTPKGWKISAFSPADFFAL